jgi:hypothetical protein
MEYLYLDRHSEHLASSRADPIDVLFLISCITYYIPIMYTSSQLRCGCQFGPFGAERGTGTR